jgi:hypothetical protein
LRIVFERFPVNVLTDLKMPPLGGKRAMFDARKRISGSNAGFADRLRAQIGGGAA